MQEGDIRRESAVGNGKSGKNGDEAGLFHLQQDIQIEGSAGSKRANGNREKAPRREGELRIKKRREQSTEKWGIIEECTKNVDAENEEFRKILLFLNFLCGNKG